MERRKSTWSVKAYLSKFDMEKVFVLKQRACLARRVFDPYRGLQKEWFEVSEGTRIKHLNSYLPPSWYDRDFTRPELDRMTEQYPPFFVFFLNKLFPLQDHRDLILDWIALAVFARPISYLCLRGLRGNGKSIFKLLIYHLVGNFYESLRDVLTEFNADIREKRIVGIDDKKAISTRDGYYMRKALLNPTMAFNEKKVQTFDSEQQHASIMILSNNSDKFYMEFDERRILSPLLSDVKMETWASEEHYAWLRAFEKDTISGDHLTFIRTIGYSLLVRLYHRRPSPNIQLKAGYFWSDVVQSLPSFQRYTLHTMLLRSPEDNTLDYEELKANYKLEDSGGNIPHWATFSNWLRSGFTFIDEGLLEPGPDSIDHSAKTFKANPAICKGKADE